MARMRRRLNVVDKLGAAWNFTASAGRAPVRASVNRVLAARADHAREVRMHHGHGLGLLLWPIVADRHRVARIGPRHAQPHGVCEPGGGWPKGHVNSHKPFWHC